jgi:flagellar protein FliO/FliZ
VVGLALRLVLSLAIVLGLFWMVARTGSKKLGGRDRGLMRVRSRQSLSRSASLAVVEVGRRVLVVGVSDGGVRLLTEMDPADLEPAPEPVATRVRRPRPTVPAVEAVPARAVAPSDVEVALEALDARMAAYGEPDETAGQSPALSPALSPTPSPALSPAEAPAEDADLVDEPSYASYQQHYEQVYDVAPVRPRTEGALAGSLLSGSTWRAAWDTAVGRANRPVDGDTA